MDWFSWLSNTHLDPSLVYEYGLAFARNELQSDDLAYFNHEFLQSMGVSVAKHRLEILKLAHKTSASAKPLSALLLAFRNARRRLHKCLSRLASRDGPPPFEAAPPPPEPARGGFLRRWTSDKDLGNHFRDSEWAYKPKKRIALSGPLNARSLKLSGPLDGMAQERLMFPDRSPRLPAKMGELKLSGPLDGKLFLANRGPKLSGPLDGRMPEKFMMVPPTMKSPRISGPLDGRAMSPMGYNNGNGDFEDHLMWAALFDDMKPT